MIKVCTHAITNHRYSLLKDNCYVSTSTWSLGCYDLLLCAFVNNMVCTHIQELIQVYQSSPVLCQAQCAFAAYSKQQQITPQLSTGPDFALTTIPSVCQDAITPTTGNGTCSPSCRQLLSVVRILFTAVLCGWVYQMQPDGSQVADPDCRGRLVNVPTFGIGQQMYVAWGCFVIYFGTKNLHQQWPRIQRVLYPLHNWSNPCKPDAAEQWWRAAPGTLGYYNRGLSLMCFTWCCRH